jgi:hypothetical protein
MQFATIKGLRIEKYTLQSQNWRESAKTNKTYDLLPPAATAYIKKGQIYEIWPPERPNGQLCVTQRRKKYI